MHASDQTVPARNAVPLYAASDAACILGVSVRGLRARARRRARRVGRDVVADLGGGVVAFKFGSTWRFRIGSVEELR